MLHKYSIIQNFKENMKVTEQLWILFYKFLIIPTGMSAVKFSVKLLPANRDFRNCCVLKFSPDFQNIQKQSL